MKTINRENVQRLILRGYRFDQVVHTVLTIRCALQTRRFLAALKNAPDIAITHGGITWTNGNCEPEWSKISAVNLSFSYQGLRVLGIRQDILEVLDTLAPAFVEGAEPRAARLGDSGTSSAQYWEEPFRCNKGHIVISIYASADDEIERQSAKLRSLDGHQGLSGWGRSIKGRHLGSDIKDRREHFGFKDGLSQPLIRGSSATENNSDNGQSISTSSRTEVNPGEFLIGHDNDQGNNYWCDSRLPALAAQFFNDGSFAALRKMQQNVAMFKANTESMARQASEHSKLSISPEYIAAKMCGRWQNGETLQANQFAPSQGQTSTSNDFDFSNDPMGLACPFGSHIRRTNPRSSSSHIPKRTLLRRGIPYGPEYEEGEADGIDRGLLGLFFCASLERQFEFMLNEWVVKPPAQPGLENNSSDPLVGNQQNSDATFNIPISDGQCLKLSGLKSFFTTRGTLYLFYPSLTAFAMLCEENTYRQQEKARTTA